MSLAALTIIPARPTHIGPIASRMREIDKIECSAHGRTPRQALRRALAVSTLAFTGIVDGRAEAMFGIAPISVLDGRASPWFLGTPMVERYGRALLDRGGAYLDVATSYFPLLENEVHRDNKRAIRLLRHWGFAVNDEAVIISGQPFLRFQMDRRNV